MSKKLSELEELILETLSFYEEMSFSKIILDLDEKKLKAFPHFTYENLEEMLMKFKKLDLISVRKVDDQFLYLRIHRKKNIFNKIKFWH